MEKQRSDQATEEWLDSQKKSTRPPYKTYWGYFLKFTKMNGNEILRSRKADKTYAWEKRVLQFKTWVIEKLHKSETTATTAANAVRGFFCYYRLDLKFRRTEARKLHEARRKSEDYRFSVDDLKKMFDIANLKERYVIVAGKSFGLRAGDFMALTRGDLEPYIEREPPISIGEYSTQKESVSAFPFIDTDAKPIIKLMLENMDRIGKTKPSDRMLDFKNIIELSRTLQRITEKASVKIGNKRVRFHCLRKFLIDHLSSYMSESKWKQIVGKKISEGAYVSPDTLRSDYARAMVETTFKKPEGNIEEMAKLEAVRAIAKSMGIKGVIHLKTRKMPMHYEIKALEKLIEKTRNGEDCNDGTHCEQNFKEIGESELLSHLQDGWKIEYKTSNGSVIIRKG